MSFKKGKVYLIGAGPGDAGLLTVKGAALLKEADVVIYDRLISEDVLAKIPEGTERINAGKNAGNHPIPQEEINKILLREALLGKIVIRLKGGDPFVFGRGGEELELLRTNDVPFEVVPGVTSAIAAAAYAGIPVTHRDFCSSLHIITGHAKGDREAEIDYESLVKLKGTLVFMMSVSNAGLIADGLMRAGMSHKTESAIVENGTTCAQRKFITTLGEIRKTVEANAIESPAVIVVGRVCSLSQKFDWFSDLPLRGCRVLVTRPQRTAGKLAGKLKDHGAKVTLYPCIETVKLDFDLHVEKYDVILFTSAFGVSCFFDALEFRQMDSRVLHGKRIAVIGTETEAELRKQGIRADFVPSVFDGTHLASELIESGMTAGGKVGLFRAKAGSEEIMEIFTKNNVPFDDIAVYETLSVKNPRLNIHDYDYITFTSVSCVKAFAEANGDTEDVKNATALCIGNQTAQEARRYGMSAMVSNIATISSMVEKIMEAHNDQ